MIKAVTFTDIIELLEGLQLKIENYQNKVSDFAIF